MTHEPETLGAAASGRAKVFFQQGCPVCGRRLEIEVGLLGRRVYCQHCGGGFVAMDPSLAMRQDSFVTERAAAPDRVDALLEQAAQVLHDQQV